MSFKPDDEIEIFTQLKNLTKIEIQTCNRLQITQVLSTNSFIIKRMAEILKNGYEVEITNLSKSIQKSHKLIRNVCKILSNLVMSDDDFCSKLSNEYDILAILDQMLYKHFLEC